MKQPVGCLNDVNEYRLEVEHFSRCIRFGVDPVIAIELAAVPHGSVGRPELADPKKAKRPTAAILRYLTLVHDEILNAFPPGKLPPVEELTTRTEKEMEPYLREPGSPGWKPVYALPRRGF